MVIGWFMVLGVSWRAELMEEKCSVCSVEATLKVLTTCSSKCGYSNREWKKKSLMDVQKL